MSDAPLTHAEARAILGLSDDADPGALAGAFRAAAKLAHPDRPGGDAQRFRQVLEAYRLLQSSWREPATLQAVRLSDFVEITPQLAIIGGDALAVLAGGREVRADIPAGVRNGETLWVAEREVIVRVLADPVLQMRGSDVWITAPVAAAVLADGGRASLATPLGERSLWVTRKIAERRLVRIEGEGLPARADFPQGDLFIRLVPDDIAPESAARAQLRKFAAAWAA